jgi:phospholipid N-methyltransferase
LSVIPRTDNLTIFPREAPEPRVPLGYRLFLRESLKSMRTTASFAPSSRFLSAAMLEPLDFRGIETVVELGCGTGAVTHAILRRLPAGARLLALDTNRPFLDHLRRNCQDHRLQIVHASAAELPSVLARFRVRDVGAIVSSLGLTGMTPTGRSSILRAAHRCLAPGGVMTQYQYVWAYKLPGFNEERLLRRYFASVGTRWVMLNFPPSVVFVCRK